MVHKKIILFFFLFAFFNSKIFSADWLITTSGTYILNDDLLSTNADSNGAIRIQSSFVTLDLNGRFIYQNNSTLGANGIVIDSGLRDVIIKNGTIVNFTRCGVTVNSGCSVISLQNLMVESCQVRAIELLGTISSQISKSEITDCKIYSCGSRSSSDYIMTLNQCISSNFKNCLIKNNSVNTSSGSIEPAIVQVDTCTNCNFENMLINSNQSGVSAIVLNVFALRSSVGCRMNNIVLRDNTVLGVVDTRGFMFFAVSRNIVFKNCSAFTNSANSNHTVVAFEISGLSDSLFERCKAIGNTAGQSVGFDVTSSSNNIIFNNCIAIGNVGTFNGGSRAAGFNLTSGTSGFMLNCFGSYNTTSSNASMVAVGVRVAGVIDWAIRNNVFIGNTNSLSDANSNGIRWDSGANNVFSQNIAARNGSTANANNIAGAAFPAGSRDTSGSSTTMNSPTAPWTNLSIAS